MCFALEAVAAQPSLNAKLDACLLAHTSTLTLDPLLLVGYMLLLCSLCPLSLPDVLATMQAVYTLETGPAVRQQLAANASTTMLPVRQEV